MRWGGTGWRGEKKTSAWLMKEERTGKIKTGQKKRAENYFCHPQHGCGSDAVLLSEESIQPTRNAASKRNGWPTWLQVRDEGEERKERETSGKRHVLLEASRLRPLLCAPRRRRASVLSKSISMLLPPPTSSPCLSRRARPASLPGSPGTLNSEMPLEPPQLLLCNPSSQIIK